MRRGSPRYDENLDESTSAEDDSYLSSDLDLLNPRGPGSSWRNSKGPSCRIDEEVESTDLLASSPRLTLRRPDCPKATETKLLRAKNTVQRTASLQNFSAEICANRHEHLVTFAEAKYSSGEGLEGKSYGKLWKGKGTPRIIKAIRRHSRRLEDRSTSPKRDDSKSSVVVLYHGKAPTPPPSSPRPLVRNSKSEGTVVHEAFPVRPIPKEVATQKKEELKQRPKSEEWTRSEVSSPKLVHRRRRVAARKCRHSGKRQDPVNVNIFHESRVVRVTPQEPWVEPDVLKCPLKTSKNPTDRQRGNWSPIQEKWRSDRKNIGSIYEKEERCRPDPGRGSRLMANRSSRTKEGDIEQRQSCGVPANLEFLVQRMQTHHKGPEGRGLFEVNAEDARRVFPFQATPSGNLKIIPNQVVFESKKVSVLVADPRHTKVNVKAEISRPGIDLPSSNLDYPDPELPPSTAEYLQTQEKSRNEQEYRPRTQPYRVKVHQVEMEQNQTQSNPVRGPSASEVPLSSLGFTGEQPIDWNNIILPEKTDLYQELARRITNYKNADCIVRIGQDEFHCHLLVLQSYSTFFDEKNCKDVDLSGSSVTSRAFSIIYDWMISPTVESCHLLRRDNILEIFMAAQYLGIKELEEQCWAFIDNDELFSEDTAFLLYLEARKIGNTAVMELMVPRIMKFFLMLVGTKDFLELSVEELCLLLRSNYICVNSEMDVLMSAVRWLMFDWDGRKQYLLDVLKCVRFGLIAPWQLVDVKRNPENPEFMELMSYPEVQKMVDDGLAFVIIKYWYGNQTEDYYHWIDLLGLTEPTNRNWAGEDKSYVTYREFLLYLEDYQRTKLPELKLRKSRGKPAPPNSPPKESPSPPPTRGRGNYFQNHGNMEAAASGQGVPSNASRNTKQPMKGQSSPYVSNGGPGGAMSPEILSEYLSNLDRGSKGGQRMAGDGELANKPGNLEARLGGGGGETLKKIYNITKSGRAFELYRPEERPSVPDSHDGGGNSKAIQETRYYQQWETNVTAKRHNDVSAHRHRWDPSLNRRSGSNRRKDPKARSSDERTESAKSEEEAATMIQATYRGYKVRRKFDEIRKTSSEEKRNAKRMAEFLSIPAGQNLPKPLEPVKVSNGSIGRERTSKERTQSPRKKIRDSSKARAKRDLRQVDDDQCSSAKDLEGLRFEVCKPQPTPRTQKLAKPADSTLMTAPTNPVETSKPIQTIKSPAFFQNCDERMSYLSPSDNTDTDDPFSPRMGERSPVDLQTRDIARGYPKLDPNYEEGKIYRATSAFQPRPRTRDIPPQTKFKRPATQKMGANVLIDGPYSENSLFHPGRESVLIFGGMDPHKLCGCTGNTGRDIYRFKPSDNVWEFIGEIPEPRHHHSVVYLRGRVYLVGGADPREDDLERKNVVVGTVWSYDPCSRVWFEEPGLLTPRKNFGLIVSHGKMFAMGGQDKNGIALRSVEAFDPVESTWREVQPMYTARMGPASAKYQDLIWVAGGMTKSKKEPISKDVECYDPLKNLWLKVEPLKSPRCFASMHVVAESLYVIGGASKISENVTESIDTIDVWDPKSCSWKLQTEMAVPRHGHSTGSIGNQLLIIGGVTTMYMRTLKSVECYSCELAKWITGVSSLPHAVSGHGSVSLPPTNVLKDY